MRYTLLTGAWAAKTAAADAEAAARSGDKEAWRKSMLDALGAISLALRADQDGFVAINDNEQEKTNG